MKRRVVLLGYIFVICVDVIFCIMALYSGFHAGKSWERSLYFILAGVELGVGFLWLYLYNRYVRRKVF